MARFSFPLVCLLAARPALGTTVIDSTGALNRGASPLTAPSKGVVAVLSTPGSDNTLFSLYSSSTDCVSANVDSTLGCVVVSSPGAILGGISDAPLYKGSGSAAASAVAGSIVLTGVTSSDCSSGITDTRHGRTLCSIFATRLDQMTEDDVEERRTLLILAVEGEVEDSDGVTADIAKVFDTTVVAAGASTDLSLEDLYELQIISVNSPEDVSNVMSMATEAGSRSPLAQTSGNVIAAVTHAYSKSSSITLPTESPSVSEQRIICEDAYTRHGRTVRAKLAAWNSRVSRSLLVEKFGVQATSLLKRTMDSYEKDTISAVGTVAASYRLEMRSKLLDRLEKGIKELFSTQVESLGKTTLKKFNTKLLRQRGKKMDSTSTSPDSATQEYNDNAAAVRAAAFAFDTALTDLEVPTLSLKKTKYSQEMSGMLNNALMVFPDSAAAQLKDLKAVKAMASKEKPKKKKPTERSIDAGIALVAMIRPDGFGNLQGFAGYTAGANSVTVGVHNDADAPETISQFGGSRPPFLRVQPKLNLDIEL